MVEDWTMRQNPKYFQILNQNPSFYLNQLLMDHTQLLQCTRFLAVVMEVELEQIVTGQLTNLKKINLSCLLYTSPSPRD